MLSNRLLFSPPTDAASTLRQAALFLLFGEALLAIMGAMIKSLSDVMTTEQILLFRNLIGFLLLAPIIFRHGFSPLRTQVWHWHLMRGLVGVTAMYCYFWALGHMPLTEAFLVKLSSPLFMPLIAAIWLSERVSAKSASALVVGFSGVILVLQPSSASTDIPIEVALIALCGALLAALAKVTIRRMGATESSQTIVFYFSIVATIVSTPAALLNWQPVPWSLWWQLVLLAAAATAGQLALTRAYRTAPTGSVGVYAYSAVIYGALMGWYFWGEIPPWTTWLGAGLILCSGVINLVTRRHQPKSST